MTDQSEDSCTEGRFGTSNREPYDFVTPGAVELGESTAHPIVVVAHELGHACSRLEDFRKRFSEAFVGDYTWTAELNADFYAYKWGFRGHMAQRRRMLSHVQHPTSHIKVVSSPGHTPRSLITIGPDHRGLIRRYWLGRSFKIHLVESFYKQK